MIPPTPAERAASLLEEAETSPQAAAQRAAIDAVLALPRASTEAIQRADALFPQLPGAGMNTLADRYRGAQLALLLRDDTLAEQRLGAVAPDRDHTLYAAALGLQAELLSRRQAWLEVLPVRVARDGWLLGEPRQQLANQQQIWALIASLPPGKLANLTNSANLAGSTTYSASSARSTELPGSARSTELPGSARSTDLATPTNLATQPLTAQISTAALRSPAEIRQLQGWLELFVALREAGTDPVAFADAVNEWRSDFPGHSARLFLPDLQQATLSPVEPPRRIAVLLPLSGTFADLGQAVLEGIVARSNAFEPFELTLQVFDTAGQPETAASLYRGLASQGVDRVIGPLLREEVDQIINLQAASVPTLILNRPTGPLRAPFTLLSLSPEADAQAAAFEALREGWMRSLLLLPEGAFGDRVSAAFTEHYQNNGGRVVGEYRLAAGSPEVNAQVGAALGIDDSTQRIQRVARELRLALEGAPQIRADIDMIFIAGPARDLRLLIPHLHYHRAARLPLLATSHAYEGRPQPALDNDLGGLRFPDAPWLFPALNPRPDLAARLGTSDEPSAALRLPRFAALGIDALEATLQQAAVAQAPQRTLAGVAGIWALHPLEHYWSRTPAWLVFREGQPQPLHVPTPDAATAVADDYLDPGADADEELDAWPLSSSEPSDSSVWPLADPGGED